MSYKGIFKPKNPSKYKGNPTNIIYRSLWECKFMGYLDTHPDVIEWASEEFAIPYLSPIDNRVHRYFPDFWVKKRNRDGTIETVVVEIKPKAQTQPPKTKSRVTKKYLEEVKTWGINSSKWKYAQKFCEERHWKFQILTENELGIK
jgi:TnsA endonuclease N terminal